MGVQRRAQLMRGIRLAIAQLEDSLVENAEERALVRALAHLWSAHDEIELLSPAEELRPGGQRRRFDGKVQPQGS
jgi:hypothetical protein